MSAIPLIAGLFGNRALRNYLEKIVGGSDNADDVLQDVALKIWDGLGDPHKPEHFVHTLARNAAIDQKRSQDRRTNRETEYATLTEVIEDSQEQIFERQQKLNAINAAISELPLLTQSIFIQFYVHGLSQKEIAEVHQIHLSTVEKRLARAKRYCYTQLHRFRE